MGQSLLSVCLSVLARELFTAGNSKAIILTDISSPFPVVLRLGQVRFARLIRPLQLGLG